MRIAVYGAGGVGGYFGGLLARAGLDVRFLTRGAHLDAIRERGLRVRSVRGDFEVRVQASDSPEDLGPGDYVLFCVKSYDTDEAAARLEPMLAEGGAVISLQNGVDNEERIARHIGWERVMGGAALIFSAIAEPGVIDHTGGTTMILFGEMDGTRSERAERLLEACRSAGVDAAIPDDIRVVLWLKFAFICAHAGMTATVRLPLGEVRDSEPAWAMYRRIVEEVGRIAAAEGVPLPPELVEEQFELARGLEPGGFSSLHHDMTHGKRMELEALHGTAVRLARKHGVPAPMCEAVYAILAPWAARNQAGR
jgi:2-dehydropantoate 2-reductase